jgi:hypothetical protein
MNEHPNVSRVSEDVKEFIVKSRDRHRSQILRLLSRPAEYFSLARNVPETQRKQVFLYAVHHHHLSMSPILTPHPAHHQKIR